jgi:hypothetical protein
MKFINFNRVILVFILSFLLMIGCEKESTVLEPCEGFLWGKAIIDGGEVCFENIRVLYKNVNTQDAYIQFTMYNGLRNTGESIDAFFRVPVEGITINTDYQAYDGEYFNTEEVVSGSLTYSYYNTIATSKDDRYSQGIFELETMNPNNPSAQSTITGEFIYNFQ